MSGLVAKRLFEFLPPRMPIAVKLDLAGNIWNHFGTRSSHYFTVGPEADVQGVMDAIQAKLDKYIVDHSIPDEIRDRFNWLSEGDVQVKESLLNHFRQLDSKLAAQGLRERLPILQEQMRNHTAQTASIRTSIRVHNHSFEIILDEGLGSNFQEGQPMRAPSKADDGAKWFFIIVGGIIAFMFILTHLR
jgi:hypothetical protein